MEYTTIGNVRIEKTASLAPMASVADKAMRTMCKKYGAALLTGEMASAKGLCYSDRKTASLLTVTDCERPMAIQLFGSEPEFMAKAAVIAAQYAPDFIDINCGCPVPKVAGNGAGSALMKNPVLLGQIVEAVVKATDIPVTVKIRKGWDENSVNAVEDRPKIASVIYNRLDDGMNLQMCSTVQYILGKAKPVLSVADTKIDSPYNTYIHSGLPKGPICSPGEASNKAALYPAKTDYMYFVVSEKLDGSHNFSKSYSKFEKDTRAYEKALAKKNKK